MPSDPTSRQLAELPAAVQVLVAGGGPVGLAAAVELGRRGIRCLVVEPRRTVSHARPRCKTLNVRTMEHLRRWGLADRLRERAPLPVAWSQDVVFCTSMVGHELSRFTGVLGLVHEGDRFPELGQQAPQYVLEELLREEVERLPACTLVTGPRVAGVAQDDAEVRITVTDETGGEALITADYLLGCDGPRSTVREQIGSAYVGTEALRPNFGMVFHAPELSRLVRHGRALHYWIINAAAPGLIGPIDREDTWWTIAFGVDRETGEREAQRLIDDAVGAPVRATVLSTDPWTARMQIVDRMRVGRVFLAGDAAHLNPPFGGHGLNTGLGDAADLGWKLAAVLDGWGGPPLLDSYETERRPIQERVIREAAANMRTISGDLLAEDLTADDEAGERARRAADRRIQEAKAPEFHSLELVLGCRITDSPVIDSHEGNGDGGSGGDGGAGAADIARPGSRLPHLWLRSGRSLFDELGADLTLLVLGGGSDSGTARGTFQRAAQSRGVPLETLDLSGRGLRDRYGADLVLVRPDQVVAWCGDTAPDDAKALIDRVVGG